MNRPAGQSLPGFPAQLLARRLPFAVQMRASQLTANNLANAETPGYRASRPIFAEHVQRQGRVLGPNGAGNVGY
eukprot:gene16625-20321_t